jgi:hypothetical protein
MNILIRILHILPFTHFYGKWSDTGTCSGYDGEERQQRFCIICNKKQYRTITNSPII